MARSSALSGWLVPGAAEETRSHAAGPRPSVVCLARGESTISVMAARTADTMWTQRIFLPGSPALKLRSQQVARAPVKFYFREPRESRRSPRLLLPLPEQPSVK